MVIRHARRRPQRLRPLGERLPRDYGNHAFVRPRRRHIDGADVCVGYLGTTKRNVQRLSQGHVVDETTRAGQKSRVFAPGDACADEVGCRDISAHRPSSSAFAARMERTALTIGS